MVTVENQANIDPEQANRVLAELEGCATRFGGRITTPIEMDVEALQERVRELEAKLCFLDPMQTKKPRPPLLPPDQTYRFRVGPEEMDLERILSEAVESGLRAVAVDWAGRAALAFHEPSMGKTFLMWAMVSGCHGFNKLGDWLLYPLGPSAKVNSGATAANLLNLYDTWRARKQHTTVAGWVKR